MSTSTPARHGAPAPGDDRGFGLAEVLIAMFLVALIAVAFLPILIKGLQAATLNTAAAAATQLVGKELTGVSGRTAPIACTDPQLQRFLIGATSRAAVHDDTNQELTVTLSATEPSTPGLCDAASAERGTLTLRVKVTDTATGKLRSSASTIVRVKP